MSFVGGWKRRLIGRNNGSLVDWVRSFVDWDRSFVGWSSSFVDWSFVDSSRSSVYRGWSFVDGCSGVFVGRCDWSLIGRGWCFVGRSRVRWSILWTFSFAFVFDICDVSVTVIFVRDNLRTAIRKGDTVRAGNYLTVATLRVSKIIVGGSIVDFP